MKILSAEEIRNWDQFTIEHEPISSIDLMERAASRVTEWILEHYPNHPYSIFCGKGNNGGDGLAVARQLLQDRPAAIVHIYILEFGAKGTEDFQANLARLHQFPQASLFYIQEEAHLPPLDPEDLVIDALFGSGLNRGLEGLTAKLVQHINNSGAKILSIDIPSGLFTDHSAKGMVTIRADHTLSFQCYKPAFLFAENEESIGDLEILDIGLLPEYLDTIHPTFEFITLHSLRSIFRPRKKFAHKGNFGHAILLAGSPGKMGAAVLAAKACLRSGAGLLSVIVPLAGVEILQISVPEAMVLNSLDIQHIDLNKFDALGIGPGIGTSDPTEELIKGILKHAGVIDADALNILAADPTLFSELRPKAILSPHPKEFDRMFGPSDNDFERAQKARTRAKEMNVIIILKGHYSLVALPDGEAFFNITGNAGMATGGSGDVLTGILTGLLAQGYAPVNAAKLGVFIHGLAGDIAAEKLSMEAMIASDITDNLGEAYLQFQIAP
jgi:NAD(P)H-hydrate epimerase